MEPLFNILPEELWGNVLDVTGDVEDIHSFLSAFPFLANRFRGRRFAWFIDQVFPLIFKHCHRNPVDILNMRATSNIWRKAVDNFLEGHPAPHSYNSEGPNRRTVPYREFYYQELEKVPSVKLSSIDDIRKCTAQFQKHADKPFIGRSLRIKSVSTAGGVEVRADPGAMLRATLDLLRHHGCQLWNLDLNFGTFDPNHCILRASDIFKMVLNCLELTPNLRTLGIVLRFDLSEFPDSYPPLPHLENLILLPSMYSGNVMDFIVNSYGRSVKGLKLQYLIQWRNPYAQVFRNLTELDFWMVGVTLEDELPKVVSQIGTRALKKIQIGTAPVMTDTILLILKVIQTHNVGIEELVVYSVDRDLDDYPFNQQLSLADVSPVSTITYLRMRDCDLVDYGFLKLLPSLQSLEMDCKVSGWNGLGNGLIRECRLGNVITLTTLVRGYMYMEPVIKQLDIWSELTALKMITVNDAAVKKQFSREIGNKYLTF